MYRVSIELYKHEWKFGRTRNAVGRVRLICGTADRGTCGTAGTCGTYIFCNKIKKKIKIVIIKMSTSGLVLKNNRERKKERKEK